jgi:hypothetical protein
MSHVVMMLFRSERNMFTVLIFCFLFPKTKTVKHPPGVYQSANSASLSVLVPIALSGVEYVD